MKSKKIDYVAYGAMIILVISIASLGIRFTGHATDTATVNVSVSSTASINFTVENVNWGTGSVDDGKIGATLDTANTKTNGTDFTAVETPLTIENVGNVNVSINLSTNTNASDFIGGTNPYFRFNVTDNEAGSCNSTDTASFTDLNESAILICQNLQFGQANDAIDLHIKIFIPSDSHTGARGQTITALATTT
jgi:hypothetical protein